MDTLTRNVYTSDPYCNIKIKEVLFVAKFVILLARCGIPRRHET